MPEGWTWAGGIQSLLSHWLPGRTQAPLPFPLCQMGLLLCSGTTGMGTKQEPVARRRLSDLAAPDLCAYSGNKKATDVGGFLMWKLQRDPKWTETTCLFALTMELNREQGLFISNRFDLGTGIWFSGGWGFSLHINIHTAPQEHSFAFFLSPFPPFPLNSLFLFLFSCFSFLPSFSSQRLFKARLTVTITACPVLTF